MYKVKVKRTPFYEEKIPIKFSIDTLNLYIQYIFVESDEIKRTDLTVIEKLFNKLDDKVYESDFQLIGRVTFIRRALYFRIHKNIENRKLLFDASISKKYEEINDILQKIVNNIDLSYKEIKYISKISKDKLNYAYIYNRREEIFDIFNQIDEGEYADFSEVAKNLRQKMTNLCVEIRKTEQLDDASGLFALTSDLFNSAVDNTVKKLRSKTNVLKTGMKWFNNMLNGGLESKRIYTIAGLTGGFKSGFALNLAYQIKQCNKYYKTKDPNAIPTILLLTHENTVEETIERLFSLCVCEDKNDNISNYTPEEAMRLLKTKGKLELTKENNIDIMVIYKKPFAINTDDIYDIIDEIEENNREVILLIHDYLWKIHSVTPSKELRIELGNATDEFKALAVAKNIPVILIAQLNRDANRIIEEAAENSKADLGKLLSSKNLGESYKIVENSDVVVAVHRERMSESHKLFLSIKRLKIRYGSDASIDYFNHEFEPNEFGLKIDYGTQSIFSVKTLVNSFINDQEKKERSNRRYSKEDGLPMHAGEEPVNITKAKDIPIEDLRLSFTEEEIKEIKGIEAYNEEIKRLNDGSKPIEQEKSKNIEYTFGAEIDDTKIIFITKLKDKKHKDDDKKKKKKKHVVHVKKKRHIIKIRKIAA